MKRLADGPAPPVNVRLLACCDEETGGAGGVEELKAHDDRLPEGDPGRFLLGEVALIPDGSPHATAGSSGLVFLDGTFGGPATLAETLRYGERLIALHDRAKQWKSVYRSPDWPDHGAPEPVITGRATLTKFDLEPGTPAPGGAFVLAAHAETDAANQIAQATTVVFGGDRAAMEAVVRGMEAEVRPPYRVAPPSGTALAVPPGSLAVQVVGVSSHGGYPHRGANPVPECLRLLSAAIAGGRLRRTTGAPPRSRSTSGCSRRWSSRPGGTTSSRRSGRRSPTTSRRRARRPPFRGPGAGITCPRTTRWPAGWSVSARRCSTPRGSSGSTGGTDASSLAGLRTPSGEPLPALVFGSMDRDAHIHEAEESADPRAIANVVRLLERFVREA